MLISGEKPEKGLGERDRYSAHLRLAGFEKTDGGSFFRNEGEPADAQQVCSGKKKQSCQSDLSGKFERFFVGAVLVFQEKPTVVTIVF